MAIAIKPNENNLQPGQVNHRASKDPLVICRNEGPSLGILGILLLIGCLQPSEHFRTGKLDEVSGFRTFITLAFSVSA